MYVTLLLLTSTGSVLIPSTWRLVRNPTGAGLSLCTSLSSTLSMTTWLGYSASQGLKVSAVSSGLLLAYHLALLSLCVRKGGTRDSLRPFFILVAALACGLLGGVSAVAVVLGLAPLAEFPQIRNAVQGEVPALSTAAYGFVVLRTLPWLPYALDHRDLALSLWVATCTAVNLTMFMVLATTRATRRDQNGNPGADGGTRADQRPAEGGGPPGGPPETEPAGIRSGPRRESDVDAMRRRPPWPGGARYGRRAGRP
jgi:hypothetical protein